MAAESEIRSSPVYAGHAIKPLDELAFAAGACSLGQDEVDNIIPDRTTEDPRFAPLNPAD
jgi:hypothetical protein